VRIPGFLVQHGVVILATLIDGPKMVHVAQAQAQAQVQAKVQAQVQVQVQV